MFVETAAKHFYIIGWAVGTFVSRLLNLFTGGRFGEPLCARIGRNAYVETTPRWFWNALSWGVDQVFFLDPRHCFRSFIRYSTIRR